MSDERGSFRQIGDLTSKIADTLSAEDTTASGSTSRATPAETGTLSTAKPTSTITRIGGRGSALPNVLPSVTPVREAMALLDPARTWVAVKASLPLSVSSSLRRKEGGYRIDPVYGYEPIPGHGFEIIEAPPSDVDAALAIVEEALRPVDGKTMLAELGTLKLITVSRSNNDSEMELVLRAYARELGRYPHDIVLAEIRKRGRSQKWWPALAELLEPIEAEMANRVDLREALMQARGE